jgi:3-phenylpropionate/cinnamic acid dioxygenase small subunit
LTKKEELEQKIDKLKYEKAAMPEDEYKSQLTAALVELARVQQELDK